MDTNLQPQNKYFEKREQKEQAAQEIKQKKFMSGALKWLIFIAIVGLIAWWGKDYFKSVSGPAPGEYFEAQSRTHINIGEEHPAYNSNPPTGGWHYDQPVQSGIYDVEFPDERIVHNLEHGHIWIAYRPDLDADQVEELAEIAKDYGSKIIMAPRPANDTKIALSAWQYLLKMDEVNEEEIRRFISYHRGIAGPEKIPDSGFDDFRNQNELPELGEQMEQAN